MQYFVIPLRLVHNILISNSKKNSIFKLRCCNNKNRVKNPKNSKNGPNLRRLWSSLLIIAKRRICDRSTSPALYYSAEFFEVCSIICHYLCGGSPYWSIEFRIIQSYQPSNLFTACWKEQILAIQYPQNIRSANLRQVPTCQCRN